MIRPRAISPEAKAVFDLDSAGLAATAVAIRDRGELPHGRKVGGVGRILRRRRGCAHRSAARLESCELDQEDGGGRTVRTDPVLHGCRDILRRYVARLEELGARQSAVPFWSASRRSPRPNRRAGSRAICLARSSRTGSSIGWIARAIQGGRTRDLHRLAQGVRARFRASPVRTSWRRSTRPRSSM